MRILGIETSCDETSVAIVSDDTGDFVLEKNQLASQVDIHAQYGGVVPEIAAREHAAIIFDLMERGEIPHDGKNIDAVAVTAGPGLVPALRIGVELGKSLAWAWGKPLVAVNHLEGHIYSVWFDQATAPQFPALCLLVSGGHTELIVMRSHGQYKLLGMTRDDAAGEAFDKVAKLLGLSYPGGPEISKAALGGNPAAINFPRPMLDSGDFDFSFSGLKTAVRVRREKFPDDTVEDVAASFQQATIGTLLTKTMRAVEKIQPTSVILSGGVSANKLLRETLKEQLILKAPETTFHVPKLSLTGDNAAMIALAGLMKAKRGEYVDPLTLVADPNMRLA